MKIIPATTDHIRDISALTKPMDTKNFHFSDPEKIKPEHYHVAIENKKIIGTIGLKHSAGSMELHIIRSTKKGTGRKLMEFAFQKCKDEKIPKLWCWSLIRYNARGFYEKMGFNEFYLLKDQWYGEDCYFFGKTITP